MVTLLLLLIPLLLFFMLFSKMANEGAEVLGAIIGAVVVGIWFLLKFVFNKILLPIADLINVAVDKCHDMIVYRNKQ